MIRFTIRDVLWLMVAAGWWMEYRACRRYRVAMDYAVREANYANMRIIELVRELDGLKKR